MKQAIAIGIECNDETHPTKTAHIATFLKQPNGAWVAAPTEAAIGFKLITRRNADKKEDPIGYLDAENQPMDISDGIPEYNRQRYSFKCPLCGLSVPARIETLQPVFNKLEQHAITAIALKDLGAIVSK